VTRRARCCCGRLAISVAGEPVLNALCHCDDCRRRTGSAFGWSAYFRDDQVVGVEGAAFEYAVPVATPQVRRFCGDCGSTLFWSTGNFPGHTGVAGGAFLDPPLSEPTAAYRAAKRCAWLTLPAAWPQHP